MTRSLMFFFVFLFPISVFADGGFVWQNENIDIHEPQQKALLIFEEGIEELVLEVKYEGAPDKFGWIVPLPSRPEMKSPTPELFEVLSKVTQRPYAGMAKQSSQMFITLCAEKEELSIEYQRVGIYDVAMLEGGTSTALSDWLKENGFHIRGNAEEILTEYRNAGWIFAAMKIAPEEINAETREQLASGEIQPVYFRFATESPVFPLKISAIMGHPSEVLLYTISPGGLVPGSHPSIHWETTCRVNIPWYGFRNDWLLADLHNRFSERKDMVLTKSRAVFEPQQMQDVYLEVYKPESFFQSKDLRQRVEAMTYLGYLAPPGSVELLLNFLHKKNLPIDTKGKHIQKIHSRDGISEGQDVRSALWALGEIIAKGESSPIEINQSIAMTKKWIDRDNIWARLEGLNSLIRISEKEAVPVCLKLFGDHPEIEYNSGFRGPIVTMSTNLLLSHGNRDCLDGLRAIIDKHYDPRSWDGMWLHRQRKKKNLRAGRVALQIAAACGDSVFREELTDILLQAATLCTWRWHVKDGKLSSGFIRNRIPNSLVPAGAIILGAMDNGDIVKQLVEHYSNRPQLRDALFRDIAHRSWDEFEIPGDYRAVLLAHVEELMDDDIAILLEVWNRSIRENDRIKIFMSQGGQAKKQDYEFNIDALGASYALGVQGEVETLLGLWETTPWTSLPEKSSLAMGLVLTDNHDAVGPVLEYVTRVWGEATFTPEFLAAVEQIEAPPYGWPYFINFDLGFRQWHITRFLEKRAVQEIQVLARDPSQPPMLKLYFILKMYRVWHDSFDMKMVALKELQPEISDPNILKRIEWALGH